ncbi:MAG: hypothetical protein CSYNP_00003 [Syntrophus sp. SKADARSKE-3]|nr:hypothetical protein [Syntrophus sp. SKADARSKE-3]
MEKAIKRLLLTLALVIPMINCGCVARYSYWLPMAENGKLVNSHGVGSIAPADTIEFFFDNIRLRVSSVVTGDGIQVGLSLLVPKGRSASFLSDETVLRGDQSLKTTSKLDVTCWDSETLRRVHIRPTDNLTDNLFAGIVMFGNLQREQYWITLPAITIDGNIHNIPEIEFIKKKGVGFFGP